MSQLILLSLLLGPVGQADYSHFERAPGFDVPLSKEPPGVAGPEFWQSGPYCGANSVYILLRLAGRPVAQADLLRSLPAEGRGASMLDMAKALEAHGIQTRIVRIAPGQLAGEPMPLIARLEPRGSDSGHFVVVFGVRPQSRHVEVVDGTTGSVGDVGPEEFNRDFSGEIIVQTRTDWSRWAVGLFKGGVAVESILGMGLVITALWNWRRGVRARPAL